MLWNVVGIVLPLVCPGFFTAFSDVPYVFYSEYFYSGEAYDKTPPKSHPFLEEFNTKSGLFYHEISILVVLIFVLIAQIIFYAFLIKLYHRLKSEKYIESDDDEMENLKEL